MSFVNLCGIDLEHPILNGSGTFDPITAVRAFGNSVVEKFPFSCFVSKTITVEARAGNPPPRLWETASGMINSIGLPNRGLEGFLMADLPRLAELPVPLMVSVAGFSEDEFKQLVSGVGERPEVAALELNISCPNVKSGCVFGLERDETNSLIRALRPLTNKPLVVKLTPNTQYVAEVALSAQEAGADALSLTNTLRAYAIHPQSGLSVLGATTGGLSGPAIKPVALAMVSQVAGVVEIPIVGMGGISNGRDAFDFMSAGATCVAVGTENFRDPLASTRIRNELEAMQSVAAG